MQVKAAAPADLQTEHHQRADPQRAPRIAGVGQDHPVVALESLMTMLARVPRSS
jgi:hypothetical protein